MLFIYFNNKIFILNLANFLRNLDFVIINMFYYILIFKRLSFIKFYNIF